MYSLMSVLVARLCNMIYSNGFKKSFWKLKLANSSLIKNLSASCRSESIAKMDTFKFSWEPTWTKCSLSIYQMRVQTKRIRAMFKSATSTKAYRLNFLELTVSLSSCLETLQRFSIKEIIASWSRLRLLWNIWSICAIWIFWTTISQLACLFCSRIALLAWDCLVFGYWEFVSKKSLSRILP